MARLFSFFLLALRVGSICAVKIMGEYYTESWTQSTYNEYQSLQAADAAQI